MHLPRGPLGWWLVATGLLVLSVGLAVRAVFASDDTTFNRVVGWANIVACVLGAVGVVLVLALRSDETPVEDSLAARVLDLERAQLARLLGTDQPDTVRIDVTFERDLVRYRGGGGAGSLDTVLDYYRALPAGRLVVVGEPGAGKTVLALHLLVALLAERTDGPVPIRFGLAGYDPGVPLDEWLARQLVERFRLRPAVAADLVRRRRVLPVLDGLDEMDDDEPVRAAVAVRRFNDYFAGTGRAPLLVTCRYEPHARLAKTLLDAVAVEIQPLSTAQVSSYLRAQLRDVDEEAAWVGVLDDPVRMAALSAALPTPWRLTLAVTAFRDGLDPHELTRPPHRVTEVLLDRFVPAATRLRGAGRYPIDQVSGTLRLIAGHLARQGRDGRSGVDLFLHEWWSAVGSGRVRHAHAALTAVAAGSAVSTALADPPGRAPGGLLGLYGPLALFCLLSAVRNLREEAVPPRTFLLGYQQRPRQRRRVLRFTLLLSPLPVLTTAAYLITGEGELPMVVGWFAFTIPAGILVGSSWGYGDVPSPRDVIRNDLRSCVPPAALNAVLYGFVIHGGPDRVTSLVDGAVLSTAIVAMLWQVWIRYALAVAIGRARFGTPLRFGQFLDWACDAGLLRVAGNAYQFRHRELQLWSERPVKATATAPSGRR